MSVIVNVVKRSGRTFFQAEWIDPVTGILKSKSTKSTKKRDAEKFAAKLAADIEAGNVYENRRLTW